MILSTKVNLKWPNYGTNTGKIVTFCLKIKKD